MSTLVLLGVVATGALAAPGFQGENSLTADVDAREGRVAPSARQRSLASGLQVTWNRLGTPQTVAPRNGYLETGLSSDQEKAARQWIVRNRALLGIRARNLETVAVTDHAVLLRQTFDGIAAGHDGLIAVGVKDGRVAYVSSSLAQDANVTGAREIGPATAVREAADDAGLSEGKVGNARQRRGWTVLDASGLDRPAQARLVAVPTPRDGVRIAWETSLLEGDDGFGSFVDAETGEVLVREGLIDHLADNPTWRVFPNSPPQDYASTDTRQRWCWLATTNCQLVLNNPASLPWDMLTSATTPPFSTFTTRGNNAVATHKWEDNTGYSVGTETATPKTDREYTYPWTNQWFTEKCNPTVFASAARNDIDAARANLFAMHNRMHDWSYGLGFTEATWNMQTYNFGRGGAEGDHEHGNAQAGGISGGPPGFQARNNANQYTPADGLLPITNMYLWQPIPAVFYAPCVDGDYDMSVIAHEYGHAISNRMAGGPSMNLSGNQPQAMGESWSDLMAIQYLHEHGYAPVGGENPFAVGPYVTGDKVAGIRNYGMNDSPLNYSDVGYDFVCNDTDCNQRTQVHADGEIWSATNYDLRQAFMARYGDNGRRWIQLVFDAWLLMATGNVSMLDARNAILAADQLRNNGINHDIMWNTFAKRGFGQAASSNGDEDFDPVPAFDSPYANEATIRFRPTGNAAGASAQLFVGRYEARATPVADTDPGTPLDDVFTLVPGTYEMLARGSGHGHVRTTLTVRAGQLRDFAVNMPDNLASTANGATATGDGVNLNALIDDTEMTNWASLNSPIAGKQVTVRLDPSRARQTFDRIQVSAMLRHIIRSQPVDNAGQSRFSALRQFELLACDARGAVDCSQASQFTSVYTSPADAFPAAIPRPRAPQLIIRSFDVPSTTATHVRLRVVTNQCTGAPAYQGDQDNDTRVNSDCDEGSTQDDNVRAAELQVFR